ncbi:MAG: phosphatase PAP2 family protein [Alphaproteobacteria bacterium]|nr:phosphatase PAP2 family protein [Alphaproteobacteria bacterium]
MSPLVHWTAHALTKFGSDPVTGALALTMAACLFISGHRRAAAAVGVTFFVAVVLLALSKFALFSRCEDVSILYGLKSPSGHSALSFVVYGFLAAFVSGAFSDWRRFVPYIAAGTLIALIAASRVMIGVHTPSDVLAGLALGGAVTLSGWRVFMKGQTVRLSWKTFLLVVLLVVTAMYGVHFSAEGTLRTLADYFRKQLPCP